MYTLMTSISVANVMTVMSKIGQDVIKREEHDIIMYVSPLGRHVVIEAIGSVTNVRAITPGKKRK